MDPFSPHQTRAQQFALDDDYGLDQNPANYGGGKSANPLGPGMDPEGARRRMWEMEGDGEEQSAPYGQPRYFDNPRHGFHAAESVESGLPLTQAAAPPAQQSKDNFRWDDDDEEMMGINGTKRDASASQINLNGKGKKKVGIVEKAKNWVQEIGSGTPKNMEGERKIHLNNPPLNDTQKFRNNTVSTSKYNLATFLPKFLFEQFSKYANLFFLFTAIIQQIPGVSPTNRYTTIAPLSLVLLVAAFKEIQEDLKRHQSDSELNARKTQALSGSQFIEKPWRDVKVGDIVRLTNNDFFPADLILLASSEPESLCYIETANLDGETNLKIKQANPNTANLTSPAQIAQLQGHLRSEQPNNSLYTYEGTFVLQTPQGMKDVPLDPTQLLLRGAQLRNTQWMYGLVVFTGHETKLFRNATAAPIKKTNVEKLVNTQIIFLFILLLILSVGSSAGSFIRTFSFSDELWYLFLSEDSESKAKTFIEDILTFLILYNNLIPISLIVTVEVVKFQQAILINSDLDMYYAPTDTPAVCRTSSLVEELGQIEYVFSDKTGTLTRNEMEFRQCSIGGIPYSDVVDETKKGEVFSFAEMRNNLANGHETAKTIDEFVTLLATCHTVIPEVKDEKITYQASSPDEAALVSGAECLGYVFTTRKPQSVFIQRFGIEQEYQVLNILEFNSTRKRMSSILRCPDGTIKLYCKGADTVILERLSENQLYVEPTTTHLEDYATEGLRTLCIAMRVIPEEEYRRWSVIYDKAAATINGRGEALDKAAELIEKNLFLLGATAIEDKLQEGVPDTIYTLQQAGIKVWVLTGDRQETAINIGLSCRLISESMTLVIVNEENANDTREFLTKRLQAVQAQRASGADLEELALIIDGKSLTFALEKELSKLFLDLAVMCKAVVCCRVSPLQKALVVKLVKKNKKALLLAIGDGANDVSMIQAAHIGVGISGVEGLQAARSADVAISQFRYLKKLLLVHGTWSYQRLSRLILYTFYKNIALYLTNFYFSFFNSFSGQVLFESWTLTFYNVLFTVLPPVVIGVFDQFVGARMLDRYPELYMLGQRNAFFSTPIFWQWIANAIYHSIAVFGFGLLVFWDELILPQGWASGQWIFGTAVYLAVLILVLGKAALLTDLWTKYSLIAIPGSLAFTFIYLPVYQIVAPAIGFSLEYDQIVPRLWSSLVFWLFIIGLPVLMLIRDFAWKSYKRLFRPQPYHLVQEIQILNLPDFRPRMDQFQKAIKKVRAVQRLRRNRGFAFSQTEEGQADLIRQYDTTLQKRVG